MIGVIINNILRAIILILVQVMLLDHMDLAGGYVVGYVYVLFLLMLPFETPPWALLLIGYMTGLVLDMFSNTPGMHTSACLILVFTRPFIQRVLAPREGYEFGQRPSVHSMGIIWWVTYGGSLILIHHIWLFFVEVWRADLFFQTLSRALLSTLFTLILCLLVQYLFGRAARK